MNPQIISAVRTLLQQGRKIEAIKAYRLATGVGLAEAKEAVEAIEAGQSEVMREPQPPPSGSYALQVFKCPGCGASLSLDEDDTHITCPFCGSTVVVPEAIRPQRAEPVQPIIIQTPAAAGPPTAQPQARSGCSVIIGIVVVALIALGSTIYTTLRRQAATNDTQALVESIQQTSQAITSNILTEVPATLDLTRLAPSPASAFANVVLQFGSEGTGNGKFDDARSIAVDPEGNIYVAEYGTGRVQKFDAAGKFLVAWNTGIDSPLRGMVADRAGHLFIVQGSDLLEFDADSGEPITQFSGGFYDDVVLLPNNNLLAADVSASRDNLVILDPQGQVVTTIQEAISGQSGETELNIRLAADGQGNIYALGTFNNAIFVFSPEGQFRNRFGSDGDEPGQFRAPGALAVDSQSRVYVSDFKGLQVFAADGRYLDLITLPDFAHAYGLTLTDQDELFVAAGTQIIKLTLNQ